MACSQNRGRLAGCTNSGSITTTLGHCGGIAGVVGENIYWNEANLNIVVENCTNTGFISGVNIDTRSVGGIIGVSCSTVVNCTNMGAVHVAYGNCGGITGSNSCASAVGAGNIYVKNCSNSGTVTNLNGNGGVGGISGRNSLVNVENCYNTGAVNGTGSDNTGGIAGSTANSSTNQKGGVISNCYNSGKVTGNERSNNVGEYSVQVQAMIRRK